MIRIFFFSILLSTLLRFDFRAQNAYQDSLETKLLLVNDSTKTVIYPALVTSYLESSNFGAAEQSSGKFLELSRRKNNVENIIRALQLLGTSKQKLIADHEQSVDLLLQALKLAEDNGLGSLEVSTLISISDVFRDINNNYEALDYLLNAESLSQKLGNTELLARAKFEISDVYLQLGDFKRALEYLNESCSISASDHNYPCLKSRIKYFELIGDFQNAIASIDSADLIIQKGTSNDAFLNYRKGLLLKKSDQPEQSLEFFEKALSFYEKEKLLADISRTSLFYGDALLKLERYDSSYKLLSKGLGYAVQINSKELILEGYEKLYRYYLTIEDFDNAEEYKDLFIEISEFINTERIEQKIGELQTQYEVGKKEQEIQVLERNREIQQLTIEKQQNRQSLLLMGIGLLSVMIFTGIWLYRAKRKNNEKLKAVNEQIEKQNVELLELNATKDRFFSIIGHDLKGPLNSLTSFSNLLVNHSGSLSPEEIKMLAQDIDKSLKNLFSLLENLLNWARSQSGKIELEPKDLDIKELIDSSISLLQKTAENKSIQIDNRVDYTLCHVDENTLSTVIRNLLSNALKFTEEGGNVTVSKTDSDKSISIHISDDGVGMTEEQVKKLFKVGEKQSTLGTSKEKGTGLGLILCKEFIEMNGGTISVSSEKDKGSTFSIHLKKI